MNKKAIPIILVLLIAIGGVFYINQKKSHETQEYLEQQSSNVNELENEKTLLESRLSQIEEDGYTPATVVFVFTNLNESLYEDIYPLMTEYGYVGIIAMSDEQYPSADDCISVSDYRTIMEDDWNSCYLWNEDETSTDWISSFQDTLDDLYLHPSLNMYFSGDSYSEDYDSALIDMEFTSIINNDSIVNTYEEEDIIHLSSVSSSDDVSGYLTQAIEDSGNVIIHVDDNDADALKTILEEIDAYDYEVNVCTLEDAMSYLDGSKTITNETTINKIKESIQSQIDEIDEQINA